jgi:aspartate kinase
MIVMKFGGATVQDAASVENAAAIIRDRLHLQPVIVISAMGKTTRRLLEAAQLASAGSGDSAVRAIDSLRENHETAARALVPDWEKTKGSGLVGSYFAELVQHLNGICMLRELSPQSRDKALSYGEMIATAILTEAFIRLGIPAVLLDSRELMITDDRFGAAAPLFDIAFDRIRSAVSGAAGSGVPVLQGFVGSTRAGHTTTLGFEGSDYTAALTGAAVGVSEIQIWKEVPGMMTADPDIVPRPFRIKSVSYEEAAELTWMGAKVLHPKAVEPALRCAIPMRIHCTKHPASAGTRITAEGGECGNPVKSIAYKKPVQLLRMHTGPDAAEESLSEALALIRGSGSTVLQISACGQRMAATLGPAVGTESLIDDLRRFGSAELVPDLASVTLVGSGLRDRKATVEQLIRQIAGSGLVLASYGTSPIACSFLVPGDETAPTVNRLHDYYFGSTDPGCFE